MHRTAAMSCAALGGGAVTGVGSLPHVDPSAAVRLVAELCPEIPFWPQLPQRAPGDLMVEQAIAPVAHLLTPREQRFGYWLARRDRAELLDRLTYGEARRRGHRVAGHRLIAPSRHRVLSWAQPAKGAPRWSRHSRGWIPTLRSRASGPMCIIA